MVLVLLPQHNVHQMHIIRVLLIMTLIVFEEKGGKYDLLMIVLKELYEIVLLQHKTKQNLMKYEIIIYNVHVVMHLPRLNLILFEGNVDYDLKVLRMNNTVRLFIFTREFLFDIEKRKRKRKQNIDGNRSSRSNSNNTTKRNDKMKKNGISININIILCINSTLHNWVLMINLMIFMLVMVKLVRIVLEKHKVHHNWGKYYIVHGGHIIMHAQQLRLVIFEKIITCYDCLMVLILQENKIVQTIHWVLAKIGLSVEKKDLKKKTQNRGSIDRKH